MTNNSGEAKKVTLKDIAVKSGVSISTVSRVLNNSPNVPTATKKMVKAVIQELGYVAKIRSNDELKQNNGFIALMVPELANPFTYELTNMIERLISQAGYSMILSIFNNDMDLIEEYSRELLAKKINGCVCICMQPMMEKSWFYKMVKKIPTVCFQSDVENLDQVETTDGEGTFEMIEHLIRLGHKRIGFIGYNWNHSLFDRRIDAYKAAHEKHGIEIDNELVCLSEANLKSGYDQACRLLSLPKRPTAIHCLNSYTAMGVHMAIRDKRLRIPEDISLSGFDETPVNQVLTPPLTVVGQPLESISSTLIQILLERMENGMEAPWRTVTFPTSLYLRQSVGRCPTK